MNTKKLLITTAVFEADTYHNANASIAFFHKAYSTSKAMVLAMPGKGSQYLLAPRDADGNFLMGEHTYRVHLPPNVPVKQFWSLTAYDAQTAVFFVDVAGTDISSLDKGIQYNKDGSIDLYIGPKPPKGKESNWIETNSDNNSIFLFRFYGPEAGVKDGSWVMDGFKKIK